MRRLIVATLAVAALVPVLLPAASAGKLAGRLSRRRAPGFSLMDTNYNQHDLADYRGRVVVLDFIRTDCPLCQTFAGVAERIRTRFGDRVAVLTVVNAPPDNVKTVGDFMQKYNVRNALLFDTFQMAASYMKLTPVNPQFALPHLFLIDGAGQIRNDYEYEPGENDAYFSGEATPLMAEIQKLVDEGTAGAKDSKKAK